MERLENDKQLAVAEAMYCRAEHAAAQHAYQARIADRVRLGTQDDPIWQNQTWRTAYRDSLRPARDFFNRSVTELA